MLESVGHRPATDFTSTAIASKKRLLPERSSHQTFAAKSAIAANRAMMRIRSDESLEIDIATHTIGSDEDIHIIQPGAGYHLFSVFHEKKVVFLDFPDLKLDQRRKPTREEARLKMVRSLAIRDWHWEDRPFPEPQRDLEFYSDKTAGRRLGRYVGAMETLYYDLPRRAIVVVPGPGMDDAVLVGEIAGPARYADWKSLYDCEPMLVRPVEWIAERPRASFRPDGRAKLGTPNPIMVLERSLRKQIVRAAYDQFSFGDEFSSRLRTSKAEFSTLDDYNIQTFVNYAAGVLAAIEDGYDGDELSFDEAIEFLERRDDLIPELTQSINSPGFQRLYSSTIAPLAIGTLLTLATSGEASAIAGNPSMPSIVNSAAKGDDHCAIEATDRATRAMRYMKLEEWRRVCAAATSARKRTGLSTSMKVGRKTE